MSNVKVAVRVRPLNKREKEQSAKIVVEVNGGDKLLLTNLKVPTNQEHDSRSRTRQFSFDFCYWSLDGNDSTRFASQQRVYEDLGSRVLEAIFEGFNTCVFAYGQSGSGKTFTMMGHKEDYGLTPRICQGLFDRLSKVADKQLTFRVEVSFMEIYNERVGDLLDQSSASNSSSLHSRRRNLRPALRVREHPKLGPCVQDLSKHVVTDFSGVQDLLSKGILNRSVAATRMHDHSSRSHAIFTINFTQANLDEELPREVVSKIHLVDLAGSERATVGMNRLHIKEGANINKSLVALGSVICALADKSFSSWNVDSSAGSPRSSPGESFSSSSTSSSCGSTSHRNHAPPFVPYRDSVLTWLLKDSLGGNSKTIMLATISPASTSYNETINTLRYAQRAKCIVNKPVINEDPNVKLIRELKAEIVRLREMLTSVQVLGSLEGKHWAPVNEIINRNQDKAKELTRIWIEKWHYFQQQVQRGSPCDVCGSITDNAGPRKSILVDSGVGGLQVVCLHDGQRCEADPDIVSSGVDKCSKHFKFYLKALSLNPILMLDEDSREKRKFVRDVAESHLQKCARSSLSCWESATDGNGNDQSISRLRRTKESDSLSIPERNAVEQRQSALPQPICDLCVASCWCCLLWEHLFKGFETRSSTLDSASSRLPSSFVDHHHVGSANEGLKVMHNRPPDVTLHDTCVCDDCPTSTKLPLIADGSDLCWDVDWPDNDDIARRHLDEKCRGMNDDLVEDSTLSQSRLLSPIAECPITSKSPSPVSLNRRHNPVAESRLTSHLAEDHKFSQIENDSSDKSSSRSLDNAPRAKSDTVLVTSSQSPNPLLPVRRLPTLRREHLPKLSCYRLGFVSSEDYASDDSVKLNTNEKTVETKDDLDAVANKLPAHRRRRPRQQAATRNRPSSESEGELSCSDSATSKWPGVALTKFQKMVEENRRKRRRKTLTTKAKLCKPVYQFRRTTTACSGIDDTTTDEKDLTSCSVIQSPPPLPQPRWSQQTKLALNDDLMRAKPNEEQKNESLDFRGGHGEVSAVLKPKILLALLSQDSDDATFVGKTQKGLRMENFDLSNVQSCDFTTDSLENVSVSYKGFPHEGANSACWPSCDSLTMVYMGPEWGSTETNLVSSRQSVDDEVSKGNCSSGASSTTSDAGFSTNTCKKSLSEGCVVSNGVVQKSLRSKSAEVGPSTPLVCRIDVSHNATLCNMLRLTPKVASLCESEQVKVSCQNQLIEKTSDQRPITVSRSCASCQTRELCNSSTQTRVSSRNVSFQTDPECSPCTTQTDPLKLDVPIQVNLLPYQHGCCGHQSRNLCHSEVVDAFCKHFCHLRNVSVSSSLEVQSGYVLSTAAPKDESCAMERELETCGHQFPYDNQPEDGNTIKESARSHAEEERGEDGSDSVSRLLHSESTSEETVSTQTEFGQSFKGFPMIDSLYLCLMSSCDHLQSICLNRLSEYESRMTTLEMRCGELSRRLRLLRKLHQARCTRGFPECDLGKTQDNNYQCRRIASSRTRPQIASSFTVPANWHESCYDYYSDDEYYKLPSNLAVSERCLYIGRQQSRESAFSDVGGLSPRQQSTELTKTTEQENFDYSGNMPEEVLCLLEECRVARQKAFEEIALATEQLIRI